MQKSVFDYLPEINADTAEEMAEQTGLDFTAIKVDIQYKYTEDEPPQEVVVESVKGMPLLPALKVPSAAQLLEKAMDAGGHIDTQPAQFSTTTNKEKEVVVPDKVAVIREDDGRYLGTVGRNRGILQYRDVLAFTESLVEQGKASYVAGGAIGNGEQAYLVMKTKESIQLSPTDEIDCYFYVATSHNSTHGLELVLAPLRKTNGTVLSGFKGTRINFRHTRRVEARVKQAAVSVDKINAYFNEMADSFHLLKGVRPTAEQLDVYLKSLFPDSPEKPQRAENTRDEVLSIYNNSLACRLPATQGTMLGAYFAVVEYIDKIRNVKASKVRPNEYDAKLHTLLEGAGAQQKTDAYAFALDLTAKFGTGSMFGNSGE
jgi:phage/plasmid-like protein (TIGR03299 family)